MSGGSFDYLYSKAPFEQLGLLDEHHAHLQQMLDRALGVKEMRIIGEDGKTDYRNNRPITDYELACVQLAKHKLKKLYDDAQALTERVKAFEDIFHSIEWTASGDTSADDIVISCENAVSGAAGESILKLVLTK